MRPTCRCARRPAAAWRTRPASALLARRRPPASGGQPRDGFGAPGSSGGTGRPRAPLPATAPQDPPRQSFLERLPGLVFSRKVAELGRHVTLVMLGEDGIGDERAVLHSSL